MESSLKRLSFIYSEVIMINLLLKYLLTLTRSHDDGSVINFHCLVFALIVVVVMNTFSHYASFTMGISILRVACCLIASFGQ